MTIKVYECTHCKERQALIVKDKGHTQGCINSYCEKVGQRRQMRKIGEQSK
jgi:hypothetical protein